MQRITLAVLVVALAALAIIGVACDPAYGTAKNYGDIDCSSGDYCDTDTDTGVGGDTDADTDTDTDADADTN